MGNPMNPYFMENRISIRRFGHFSPITMATFLDDFIMANPLNMAGSWKILQIWMVHGKSDEHGWLIMEDPTTSNRGTLKLMVYFMENPMNVMIWPFKSINMI